MHLLRTPRSSGTKPKPSSGRKVAPLGDGRSLRAPHFFACFITTAFPKLRTLPQSPTAPAFGPGRKHSLLPAWAKNMPQAYFLNASRPPGGSLSQNTSCLYPLFTSPHRLTSIEPRDYSVVFDLQTKKRPFRISFWSWRWDSNPRPIDYESIALPATLLQQLNHYTTYFQKNQ